MLGLLYKDIRTNLKWLILALSIVLFFNAVMFSADVKSHDIDFIGMRAVYLLLYSSVFFTIAAFAINFIQTDERKKWGYFVVSMPHGIAKQVAAKYIFVAGVLMLGFALSYAQNFLVRQLNDEARSISGVLIILVSITLIMLSVELPCAFAFGSKNGAYVKSGLLVLIILFCAVYLMFGDISWLGSEEEFTEKFMNKLSDISKNSTAVRFAAAAVPMYCVSCFISTKLYLGGIERMEK